VIGELFFLAALLQAPTSEPTALERLTPGFHGAVGTFVEAEWMLESDAVVVGKPLRAVLQIRGAVNPEQLTVPPLFGKGKADYQAGGGKLTIVQSAAPTVVEFGFELIPNRAGTHELPSVKYAYFRPSFPEGRRFGTAYADRKTFSAASVEDSMPLQRTPVPEELLQPIAATRPIPSAAAFVPLLFIPWLVFTAVRLHGRFYPDAVGLATLRNVRAVRIAWKRLGNAQSPHAVQRTVCEWLSARHGLPSDAKTSADLEGSWLQPPVWAATAVAVVRDCERARFAAEGPSLAAVTEDARRLLVSIEGKA